MSDGLGSTQGGASPQLSSEPLPAPDPLSKAELPSVALAGPGERAHTGGNEISPKVRQLKEVRQELDARGLFRIKPASHGLSLSQIVFRSHSG